MDENVLKFRVGIFVVIALVILAILIFLNSEGWVRQYTLFIKPTSAPGVTVGTPIRKNGILIGRVTGVTTEDDHVRLKLAINQNEKIYENEVCSIGAESILGDAVVEFLPLSAAERGSPVREEHVMEKVALKRNPLEFVDMFADLKPELSETLSVVRTGASSVSDAGIEISKLSQTIQTVFDDDESDLKALLKDLRTMSQRAQVTLENFNRIFENVNNVVGDPELKGRIKDALTEIPKMFQEVRVTVADTRKAINAFGEIPEGLGEIRDGVQVNLDNMSAFTGALKDRGPEILDQVNSSLKNVDDFVEDIRKFTSSLQNLQNSEGTIGKLLNDPSIYDTALETVEQIRDISVKIEPMVNDLRMFADSIARDPGVLGVRGAINGRGRPDKTGAKNNAAGRNGGLFRMLK